MSSFVIAIAVSLVLSLLLKAARPQARRLGDLNVVEYGVVLKALAWFFLACAIAPVVGAFFVDAEDRLYVLGISGIFGVISAYLLPLVLLTRFEYDEVGIKAFRPWRKCVSAAWVDVVNVQYSPGHRSHVVALRDQGKFHLHEYMSGVPDVLAKMRSKGVPGALVSP
jgi:hypothetical protein